MVEMQKVKSGHVPCFYGSYRFNDKHIIFTRIICLKIQYFVLMDCSFVVGLNHLLYLAKSCILAKQK